MTPNTNGLGLAIAARQDADLLAMLQRQADRIAELEDASATMLAEKDGVIQQYARMTEDQALTIARLRSQLGNNSLLAQAVAARNIAQAAR